jgi:flagellar hook assembly protein FlgD
MPDSISLRLYNSAGELVRSLYQGLAQDAPTQVLMSQSSLAAGSGVVSFLFSGALSGILGQSGTSAIAWDGRNDNGQLVAGGQYYAQIKTTDSFGHSSTLVDSVTVIQAVLSQQLNVYNSAGEVVAQVPLTATAMTSRFEVPQPSKALSLDPATGLPLSGFQILLIASTGQQIWTQWNGLNSQGIPVGPGLYTLELVTEEPGQGLQRLDKQVQVLTAPLTLSLGKPIVAPQPYRSGTLTVFFKALPGNESIHGRLYNQAGELVLESWGRSGGGRLALDQASKLASGVYVLELTWVRGSGVVERQMAKVAVAR